MFKIKDLKIGYSKEFSVEIKLKDHNLFKELSKDNSPVHNDDAFAVSCGYKKKIAYGFHIVSYISQFYGNHLPGGSSVCINQNIKFLKPIYIGEKITVKGTVTNINYKIRIISIRNEVLNSKKELCIEGNGILKVFK